MRDIPVNVWYEKLFNPVEVSPPDCWRPGGLKPEQNCAKIQSKLCVSCPQNRWGSGVSRDGMPSRGKACSNLRRLILKLAGVDFPVILNLPPTSVKSFNQYLKTLCTNVPPLPVSAIKTEFGFDSSVSDPKPTIAMKDLLSVDDYLEIRGYRKSKTVENALQAYMDYVGEDLADVDGVVTADI